VSRRSRRADEAYGRGARAGGDARSGAREGGGPPSGDRPEPGAPGRPPNKISFAGQVGILVAVFAATVGLAELFGAANLGIAFGIGQIVFAIVLVALLLRA
jgi:hypothetical protein